MSGFANRIRFEGDTSLPRGKLFGDSLGSELKNSQVKSGSKKKTSGVNASYAAGNGNNIDSASTPAVKQAKEDLLRLGIELDDELINRLQNNLGIDKIFDVAHQAATILAPQPSLDLASQNPEIAFRHVSHGHAKVGFSLDTRQPVHASLQPFVSDLIAINPKHSIQILKQLDNRADEIEPQYRPQLDQMIQSFRLQYARAPCRFIGRLLGRKWNSATDKTQEESLITRWILKTRYVTKQDFTTMILRVAPKAKVEVVHTLFLLLREEKQFGNPQKQTIVDLWAFLTLLKTASEESRRSFDGSKSKLANQVEFWREKNAGTVGGLYASSEQHPSESTQPQAGVSGTSRKGLPPQPPIEEGWRLFENIESANIRHVESQTKRSHKKTTSPVSSSSSSSSTKVAGTANVANLLGQPHFRHSAEVHSGREVMGRLYSEVVNTCDIPAALNSPPHLQRRHPSAMLPHDALKREAVLPLPPAQYVHDSRNVAYLLNNKDYVHQAMTIERPPAANILQRELLNNTSVAFALGQPETKTNSRKATTIHNINNSNNNNNNSNNNRNNQNLHTKSTNNNNNNNKGTSLASYVTKATTTASSSSSTKTTTPSGGNQTQGTGRMRMSSVHDLHWEDARPSVAAALGRG